MIDAAIITSTLETVAERCGDPKERVFKRLYELDPKFEPLFVMDTDGGVRGSMLETSLNCMIGVAQGESQTPRLLIEAARMIHDGYGGRGRESFILPRKAGEVAAQRSEGEFSRGGLSASPPSRA
jgi:hypothetical protein